MTSRIQRLKCLHLQGFLINKNTYVTKEFCNKCTIHDKNCLFTFVGVNFNIKTFGQFYDAHTFQSGVV